MDCGQRERVQDTNTRREAEMGQFGLGGSHWITKLKGTEAS